MWSARLLLASSLPGERLFPSKRRDLGACLKERRKGQEGGKQLVESHVGSENRKKTRAFKEVFVFSESVYCPSKALQPLGQASGRKVHYMRQDSSSAS